MTCPHCSFQTPGSGRKGPMNQGLSFCPCLEVFLGLAHQFCLKLSMVLVAHVLLCVTRPDVLCVTGPYFFKKIFLPPKWGKWAKNGRKTGFFKFIGKFSHQFCLNLVYKGILYNLLYSCTNLMLGKNLVPEIWTKMTKSIFKLTISLEQNDEKV